jgi:hypothetical protein
MERDTDDPDALERLFLLDHLTTRMRRQAEGLIVLSGASPGRIWREPVPMTEVMRGAIGEIEDYARVRLLVDSPDSVQGTAVADMTHMLAELVENAVLYSPPDTAVQVRSGRVATGYVVEVEDHGLGIPSDTMTVLNELLAQPPEFDLADRLGLFVVSRLAARHGVRVSLCEGTYGGTRAIVLLPPSLVVAQRPASVPVQVGSSARTDQSVGAGRLPRRTVGGDPARRTKDSPRGESPAGRSPEHARRLMSSIQQGLRNSREQSSPDGAADQGSGHDPAQA